MTDDDITLPPLTDEQCIDLAREAGLDWHQGFPIGGEEENRYAVMCRAAVLLDRQRHALRRLAEADKALGLSYDDEPAPSAEPTMEQALAVAAYLDDKYSCWHGVGALDVLEVWRKLTEQAPPPAPSAEPCPHIRSSGTGERATNWCSLNPPAPSAEPVQIDKPADIKTDAISYGEEAYMDADPCPRKMAAQWRNASTQALADLSEMRLTVLRQDAVMRQALDALETIPPGGADLNQLALTVAEVTLALRAALEGK